MDLVRDLTLCTLRYNFYFQAVHVPGINNNIADSLSRFQMECFHQLAPHTKTKSQDEIQGAEKQEESIECPGTTFSRAGELDKVS